MDQLTCGHLPLSLLASDDDGCRQGEVVNLVFIFTLIGTVEQKKSLMNLCRHTFLADSHS